MNTSQKFSDEKAGEICAKCQVYEIELCVNLAHPCDIVGHTFVAVDEVKADCSKTGNKVVRGFYPKKESDPKSVIELAPGVVKKDDKYYNEEPNLYKKKLFTITCAQAQAALKFIKNREKNPGIYGLWTRQCNNFALDVLSAAGIPTVDYIPKYGPVRPSYTYQVLSGQNIPAASWLPVKCVGKNTADSMKELWNNMLDKFSSADDAILNEWDRATRSVENELMQELGRYPSSSETDIRIMERIFGVPPY